MLDSSPQNHFQKVYWLGGSPCSGKTSISQLLAEQFDLTIYHVDSEIDRHIPLFSKEHSPCLWHWQQLSWEDRWMRPVDLLLEEVIGCYGEHFSFILLDILAMAGDSLLLVEGTALLPDRVLPLIPSLAHAVWVIPAPEFQVRQYSQRAFAKDILASCTAPERAFENWMNRDIAFGRWIADRTRQLGLPSFEVDGTGTIAENARRVAEGFGLLT